MSSIACQYPDRKKFGFKGKVNCRQSRLTAYRVAIIGEFKRSKSSLINALLGTRALPTDILPMTAAITHVSYGDVKKF